MPDEQADGRIDHAHLILRQSQRMGDLFLVFVHPLPRDLNRDAPGFIDIGQPCFGLQIGMLLRAREVGILDDDIRTRETGDYEGAANGLQVENSGTVTRIALTPLAVIGDTVMVGLVVSAVALIAACQSGFGFVP